ncbi:MAG: hypothetical protein MUF42_08680 [Cytophagaceae bacterium]|jgi:hypothetical protein|nr:hypothetical protein [Cytophagaceae bacterium]
MRGIDIADSKNRNTEVLYFSPAEKKKIRFISEHGEETKTQKLIKTGKSLSQLLSAVEGDTAALAEALIEGDPEIDLELVGKYAGTVNKVYINSDLEVVHRVEKKEWVYSPKGELIEERKPKHLVANVKESTFPVKGAKYFPKKEIFNKFIFTRKYQLRHTDGLSFDFLFGIAKELHEKDSMLLMGAGAKGNEPLVFDDGGKPYRAFLEGKIEEDRYLLVMHLSNLELKALPND